MTEIVDVEITAERRHPEEITSQPKADAILLTSEPLGVATPSCTAAVPGRSESAGVRRHGFTGRRGGVGS
jgi:hypothetical protein